MCTLSRFLVGSVIAALLPCLTQAAPFAYISNGGSNDISVIDMATNALVAAVPVGNEPEGVAVSATGTRVYVTNQFSNSVSVIDGATNTVVATVPVGTWPRGITVNPSGTRVYVANYASANVSIIDAASNTVVGTVGVNLGPRGIVSDPSGARVYVANWSAGSIQVIDTATNTVTTLPCPVGGAPAGIALNPAGTRMYVALAGAWEVAIYDMVTNSCFDRIRVGAFPYGVAVNKGGTRLYVTNNHAATVSVIDTGSNAVIATTSVGQYPYGVAIDTTGRLAYVANQLSNNVSVIDTESNTVIATVAAGRFPSAFGQFIGPSSEYSRSYVQKAYVAYYGRPADPGGQSYWAGRMDAEGQSLNAIIGAFGYSDEFNRRYGGLSYADLVTKIYQQALGRDPDQGGLDWYVAELTAGRRTLQTITLDVLNGATTAPDSMVVANKLDVAAYYTAKVAAGCAYGTETDGVNAIAGVTANPASVTGANAGIDTRCGP